MSWLRKGQSLIRQSVSSSKLSEVERPSSPLTHIDSKAALDSFKAHWLQAWDIMKRKTRPPGQMSNGDTDDYDNVITTDDVTTIVNHIDQMTTLLIQESKGLTKEEEAGSSVDDNYMLSPLLG